MQRTQRSGPSHRDVLQVDVSHSDVLRWEERRDAQARCPEPAVSLCPFVPLASLPIAGEVHECVNALKDELRRAKFDSAAASTHQTRMLKEEMEKAFNKNLKGTEAMKSIIVDMMTQHSKSVDARLQDLDVLKEYIREARRDKETLQEFELQQIIDVISESIALNEAVPSSHLADAVLDQLRCPISMEVMKDPVMLKDSGMTYERDSIVKWMGKGHKEDPMNRILLMK